MKKLMLFAVAALGLAACTNEEEVYTGQPQEISFEAVNGKATRAIVDGSYLTTDGKVKSDNNAYLPMWVSAQYTKGGTGATHGYYFKHEKFTFGTEKWHGENKYYYPANGTDGDHMDFMAISVNPASPSTYVIKDADDTKTTTFNATATWSSVADWTNIPTQTDKSIVKLAFKDLGTETDVLYSQPKTNVSCPPSEDPTMKFKHALAWVNFKIRVKENVTGVIKIKSITLNNVKLSNNLAINVSSTTSGSTTTYSTSPVWDLSSSTAANLPVYSETNSDNYIDPAAQTGNALVRSVLIPKQTRTGFTITYQIQNGTETPVDLTYTYNSGDYGYGSLNWDDNHKYIYDILINLNEIVLQANVSGYGWDDNGGSDTSTTDTYTITVTSTTNVSPGAGGGSGGGSSAPARK